MAIEDTVTVKTQHLSLCCLLMLIILSACGDSIEQDKLLNSVKKAEPGPALSKARWYRDEQLLRGETLYLTHCAKCHQADSSGTINWNIPDEQGRYPPPPLNGTAHTWHHSLDVLRRTVKRGGIPLGGWMPGFADQLDDQQIDDILAWIQSQWSDEVYKIWQTRNMHSMNDAMKTK
ncbi:MAG: cytochrome c [Candidatus Thiodiazotropha sp. (ex Monitilora ramsayi)]|nr:cytochrome c [Candidatus Thiodiazotropha sp. (ex Monitilora ramsayi)]